MPFVIRTPETGTETDLTEPSTADTPTVLPQDKLSAFGVKTSSDGKPLFPGFNRAPGASPTEEYPSRSTWTAYTRSDAGRSGKTEPGLGDFATIVMSLMMNPEFRQPVADWQPKSGSLVTFPDATAEDTQSFYLLESNGGHAEEAESENEDLENKVVKSSDTAQESANSHEGGAPQ